MNRLLAVSVILAHVLCSWAGDDAIPKLQQTEFAKLKGKWQRVNPKEDATAKHITLEFFQKQAGTVVSAFLRVQMKWQEQGQAKQEETTKACRFHKDGNVLAFTLTVGPVSAETGLWVKYNLAQDKLELQELPPINSKASLGLTGTYQRVPDSAK